MPLNRFPYSIRNYLPQGTGWRLSDAGVVELIAEGFEDTVISANIQPHTSRTRMQDGQGFTTLDGIKMYVDPAVDGTWPLLLAGDNVLRRLPTRLYYGGAWYEIHKVKTDWTHGLMPHLYAEATLLILDLNAGPVSDDIDAEVPPTQLDW